MQKLLIATKNPGKFHEITNSLGELPYEYVFLNDLGVEDSDFVEDGKTFKENALKKAKYYFGKTKLMTLGEDSGILVDALGGELGVKTRRWGAGESASDDEWLEVFVGRMTDEKNRDAKFVCAACLIDEKGNARDFEGETSGKITEKIMAPILKGLPLSSVFLPNGFDNVYAALSTEEKNMVSHRGKAMAKVALFLGSHDKS